MRQIELTVGHAQAGLRLDVYLVQSGLELSRRRIRQIIDVGGVYVNRKRVRIASRQVARGDQIRVEYSETVLKQLKAGGVTFSPDDLLLDRGGVLAVNKPPGLPSQATKDQQVQHVVPCLEALLKAQGGKPRRSLILVHRLDKETSGVLLVADGAERATWLTDQFRERQVTKRYLAICYGEPAAETFTERSPLSEIDKRTGDVRVVRSGGRPAVTHFKVLARNRVLGLCLLECRPETGRSHQIRVHLEVNGLPIVGDKRYGAGRRRSLPPELAELASLHHFLHAASLDFVPAEGEAACHVEAQPPERFVKFMIAAGLGGADFPAPVE